MGETITVNGISGERLKSFVDRIEHLLEEKKGIAEDVKEIYAEAKGVGFDPKIIKELIKLRARDPEEAKEAAILLDIYMEALGEKTPDI